MGWHLKLSVALIAACSCLLLLTPASSLANTEAGHPEIYVNGALGETKASPTATLSWGAVTLASAALPAAVECATHGVGSLWNEEQAGTLRGIGQMLKWDADATVADTTVATTFAASCRVGGEPASPGAYLTSELPAAEEENAEHEVEPSRRNLTLPWNEELNCGVRGRKFIAIVTLGVPNSEFPRSATGCPAEVSTAEEAKEIEGYKKEYEQKKGCYASVPSPAGCVRITLVEPAAGIELAFGGSVRAKWVNGAKTGLSPSRRQYEGTSSGYLQCETRGCNATATVSGNVDEDGFQSLQLIQAK